MSNYMVFIEYIQLSGTSYSSTKVFSATVNAKDGATAMAYVLSLFNQLSNCNEDNMPYIVINSVSYGNA